MATALCLSGGCDSSNHGAGGSGGCIANSSSSSSSSSGSTGAGGVVRYPGWLDDPDIWEPDASLPEALQQSCQVHRARLPNSHVP